MKPITKLTLLLLALLIPATALAHHFKAGMFQYHITSDTTITLSMYDYRSIDGDFTNGLLDIEIPSHVTYKDVDYTVTAIGDSAFFNNVFFCITIPETVVSIGKNAFGSNGAYGNALNLICLSMTPPVINELSSNAILNLYVYEDAYPLYEKINNQYHYFSSIHITNGERTWVDFWCTDLGYPDMPDYHGFIAYFSSSENSTIFYKYHVYNATGAVGVYGDEWINGDYLHYESEALCMAEKVLLEAYAIEEGYSPSSIISEWQWGGEGGYRNAWSMSFDFKESGIAYDRNGNNLSVTYCYYFSNCGYCFERIPYSKNIVIPESVYSNSVTSIGDGAFSSAYFTDESDYTPTIDELLSVTLPSSISSVGWYAFGDSPNLSYIKCLSVIPPTTSTRTEYSYGQGHDIYGSFDEAVLQNTTLYVPIAALDAYKAADGWKDFKHIVGFYDYDFLVDGVYYKVISDNEVMVTYGEDTHQDVITIPSTVTYDGMTYNVTGINTGAFSNRSGLTSVTIPNSITQIGDGAFYGCTELNEVNSYISNLSQLTMGDDVFGHYQGDYNYTDRTLHVPYSTSAAYQADSNWSTYFGYIEESVNNYFSLPDMEVMHGDTITIPVQMTNQENIMAFQTDIILPEGFTLLADEDDIPIITASPRLTSDHVIMANQLNDGSVRIICYTPRSRVISGNEGDLFYFTVAVPRGVSGDYNIYLRNSLLTTTEYTELSIPDAGAVINVKTYIPGDVNDSRTVTVTDIVVTAQYVLQRNPSPFIFDAADMNGDGNISVTDIMLIARLIMTPPSNVPSRMPALEANDDRLSGEGITISTGETRRVSIALDNVMAYSAFQFDLNLPQGLTASNLALTDRAGSHILDVQALSDGKLRALCYSPAIEPIIGTEGALLTFDVTASAPVAGGITVDGIEMVTTSCQTVLPQAFTIPVNNTTAVTEASASRTVARVDYYNAAGQRLDGPATGLTIIVTTYTDGTRSISKVFQ